MIANLLKSFPDQFYDLRMDHDIAWWTRPPANKNHPARWWAFFCCLRGLFFPCAALCGVACALLFHYVYCTLLHGLVRPESNLVFQYIAVAPPQMRKRWTLASLAGAAASATRELRTFIDTVHQNFRGTFFTFRGIFNKTHLLSSVCEASKLRSLPFTHPIYVASRSFQ